MIKIVDINKITLTNYYFGMKQVQLLTSDCGSCYHCNEIAFMRLHESQNTNHIVSIK